VHQRIPAKAMRGEARERVPVPAAWSFYPAQRGELILFVGDAEAGFEEDMCAEFAEQFRAEGVDCTSLYLLGLLSTEPGFEPMADFASGLVGEGESTDASGVEAVVFDQEADTLDETVCLSGTRASENEE
jgi:hypothetical protein